MKRFNFTGTSKEKDILGSLNICSPQSLWIIKKKLYDTLVTKVKKQKKDIDIWRQFINSLIFHKLTVNPFNSQDLIVNSPL